MNRSLWDRTGRVVSAAIALALLSAGMICAQESHKLTLKSAVTLALANSHAVAMAQAQYTVAKAEIAVNRSPFLPNLFTGSGLAYTYGFPEALGGNPPSIFNLGYTQDIFNPLLQGQLRAARQRAENQRLELEKTRDAVMVSAASDYLELAEVRHSLELLRTERTSQQSILDVIRDRVSSGVELPIESTRMELALARVEQRIVQLGGRDDALADELRDLVGIHSDVPIEVFAEDLPSQDIPAEAESAPRNAANDVISQAIAFSPDVKEALNEKTAQTEIWKGARGGYWPTVSLVGEYSILSRINNYDQFYKSFQRNNLNIGIQLTIPIFSARTRAEVELAHSQVATAELTESQARRDAGTAAKQRLRDLREADAARKVARLDLQLSREGLDAAQTRYDQGHATLRDLEQARVDENEKWLAFLEADFTRQKAQLALWQTTGELAQHLQ
jgi:outer membrane protein TolC